MWLSINHIHIKCQIYFMTFYYASTLTKKNLPHAAYCLKKSKISFRVKLSHSIIFYDYHSFPIPIHFIINILFIVNLIQHSWVFLQHTVWVEDHFLFFSFISEKSTLMMKFKKKKKEKKNKTKFNVSKASSTWWYV